LDIKIDQKGGDDDRETDPDHVTVEKCASSHGLSPPAAARLGAPEFRVIYPRTGFSYNLAVQSVSILARGLLRLKRMSDNIQAVYPASLDKLQLVRLPWKSAKMIYLQSISLPPHRKRPSGYPFEIPLVKSLRELRLSAPVTFLVGENGSGKSTLLEALAVGIGSVAVGGAETDRDASLDRVRALSRAMKFVWSKKTHRGFFLRAEDFFNFARRLQALTRELEETAAGYERDYHGSALDLARGAVLGQRRALIEKYGEDLDANSHGESFLKLFQARFVPGGLYLLDEPEAPLSPQRQLALLAMLKEMVEAEAQFIIATHSPIIMALPGASIINCDLRPPREVAYDEVEHVALTRAFLKNPESFLRRL
jgi:predicted ATPase